MRGAGEDGRGDCFSMERRPSDQGEVWEVGGEGNAGDRPSEHGGGGEGDMGDARLQEQWEGWEKGLRE